MALLKRTQRSFAGGQLDKDLMGRQDLAKYSQGCLTLENFKVRKQGNVVKRSGTDLVCDFSHILSWDHPPANAKLIPLIQERESGFYILLTGGYAFLVSPEGVKNVDDTWTREPFPVTEDDNLQPYFIEVPFSDEDLKMLDWCQSGDTIFFAHRLYPPGRIVYSSGTLSYEEIQFRQGRGTPPQISSIQKLGTWNGTGGTVHVEYAVTAVKDGVETGMSVPAATDYNAPWGDSNSIRINIDTSGMAPDSWDCFYIYKKEADVFGLIGTTSQQMSFIDISSGFSANRTLYPNGYTTFDKAVHLRESGNKFASVYQIAKSTKEVVTAVAEYSPENYSSSRPVELFPHEDEALDYIASKSTTTTTNNGTARSATAQQTHPSSIVFQFSQVTMSTFSVRIGSLEHVLKQETTKNTKAYYAYLLVAYFMVNTTPYKKKTTSTSTKWTGLKSVFTACPAKFFAARVEYYDGSNWVTTSAFDCSAVVDQSDPGTGWTAVSGEANKWERTYGSSDAMWSYTDAAAVLARMDANAPSVGATVNFTVPSAAVGKPIRKIVFYGYTDSGKQTAARIVVNGLACYQQGSNVTNFIDDYITPDLTITPPKTEDHFVNPGEYPGCVAIYNQRLVLASTAKEPFTFWMSCTGDISNFDVHEYVRASDAIKASTAALEMPRINRMLVQRDLMMFADGGEWQVAPSAGNAVAPSTVAAKLQSVIGCAAWLKPMLVDADIIFCDGSGETLMATRYNFASDGYESSNLSVLSQRIFRNNPIRAMAYAQFPESTIECVLEDGTIASLVYMREHDVCAWSHHVLGGGWKALDVAANKAVAAGSSHCAFIATRTGTTTAEMGLETERQWAILSLRDIDPNDDTLFGNLRMDAVYTRHRSYRPSEETPGPLDPGNGDTAVKVGWKYTSTSHGRRIQETWAVGSPFKSVIKTTSPEFTDKETAQMEVKNATESEIRVIDGSDFTVRQPEVPAEKATKMKVKTEVNEKTNEYTVSTGDADVRLPLVGTNTINGSIILEHDGHLPLAVLSVTTSYRVEFANHANGGSGDE